MNMWKTFGALLQAVGLGILLAAALAKLVMASGGISAFKYQGF